MSNDTIARTIAAVFRVRAEIAAARRGVAYAPYFRHDDLLALCDAAEAGLRCPPREPTQEMDAAVGNDADARDAVAPSPPVPPSPAAPDNDAFLRGYNRGLQHAQERADAAPARTVQEIIGNPRVCVTTEAAAPAPDADELVRRLRGVCNKHLCTACSNECHEAAGMIDEQAEQIERLTRERDEDHQKYACLRTHQQNETKRAFAANFRADCAEAECERLRTVIAAVRGLYQVTHIHAAIDAARGEGKK